MPRAAIFQKESLAICSAANLASACASSFEITPSPFWSMRCICLSCAGVRTDSSRTSSGCSLGLAALMLPGHRGGGRVGQSRAHQRVEARGRWRCGPAGREAGLNGLVSGAWPGYG